MIPQYSKKQILASYDEPIDTNVLWLHLQRTKEFEKPILKYYSPHGWILLNDSLWDFNVNGVLTPKDNYKFSLTDAIEIKIQNGDDTLFLNEKGNFTKPLITHPALNGKNAEAGFQHITETEKTNFVAASDFVKALIENATAIAREELLVLINNNELSPNSSYRINNYTTTTAQVDTTSAGHDFDIIVTALSINELSENAKCIRKADDTYFANVNLEAWEIKYCINNNVNRFAWADEVSGKGVIYYMKDEWNNECPYDFKNIKFLNENDVYVFTFGRTADDSLTGNSVGNTIKEYKSSNKLSLNFNTFGTNCSLNTLGFNSYNNTFDNYCHSNTFGNDCYSNTFDTGCRSNEFGDNCNSNMFDNNCHSNMFGEGCYYNTFGENCQSNTFGTGCSTNTFSNDCSINTFVNNSGSNMFGVNCRYNTFGNECHNNTFGTDCSSNTFGNYSSSNTFGNYCHFNTFSNDCYGNTFGNWCWTNTFGSKCSHNNFYAGTTGATKKDYIKYLVLEDGCTNNNFYSTLSGSSYLQRIRIKGLEHTTQTDTQITLPTTNTNYEWLIYYTTDGVLKQHSPDYSLINNYTYKIEDTTVSTWTASTAYVGYDYQAQIDIADLTENDIVSVIFSGADAMSGNYYPTIQIYEGFILIFSKVNATITIPTIEITKIDL